MTFSDYAGYYVLLVITGIACILFFGNRSDD
jgi:hypothetical protein